MLHQQNVTYDNTSMPTQLHEKKQVQKYLQHREAEQAFLIPQKNQPSIRKINSYVYVKNSIEKYYF